MMKRYCRPSPLVKPTTGAEAASIWHKGATSGLPYVTELLIDDDQDAVWLRVDVEFGASCHVGYVPVFIGQYRSAANQMNPSNCCSQRQKRPLTRRRSTETRPIQRNFEWDTALPRE